MGKKLANFFKENITFFIIYGIALILFVIALCGNYQTVTRYFQTESYGFLNGPDHDVSLAILYVIAPIVLFVATPVVKFFVPNNKMLKRAGVMAGFFIGFAIATCVVLLLLLIVIPDESKPVFTSIGDAANNMSDIGYLRTLHFPFLSMVLCLISLIVLNCYGASTCSD